jgi:putative flavoprotein involved in K+ transport
MDAAGVLDERWDQVDDLVRARNLPSPQLIGTRERRTIDLNSLAALGVRLVGRIGRVHGGIAQFSGSLTNTAALADLKLDRLRRRLDEWAHTAGVDAADPEPFAPTAVPARPTLEIDLDSGEIATIVWATGYRPDYRWLDLPVLDRRGRIIHQGGVVAGLPGLYVLGLSLLRTRRSNFIDGSSADTTWIADMCRRR